MRCETVEPCGPECRHARSLAHGAGEWIWCIRRGEPRFVGRGASECISFAPSAFPDARRDQAGTSDALVESALAAAGGDRLDGPAAAGVQRIEAENADW
jgi:hypothetical protein